MLYIQKLINQKISLLGIIKIGIIILTSVYLLGNFMPFYQPFSSDAYLYGFGAINIANGSFEYTNEFIQNPNYDGFAFGPWIKTVQDTAIPFGHFGIYGFSAISYFLGGYYALFYLGPITTILFLIISERVITKLLGGFAGLVALIFLSTDFKILMLGRNLMTDSIFSLLLILGCFFLINFLKEKNNISILLCSCFLVAATSFRLNGVIYLPIEILIVVSYFLFQYIKIRKEDGDAKSSFNLNFLKQLSKIEIKKILKISLYALGPWFVFFIFLFSFNSYFFGDPFTTYLEHKRGLTTENLISSNLIFDSKRFDSIISYSTAILPDEIYIQLKKVLFNSDSFEPFLSIISFSLLFSALFISLKYKINRKEIIVFIIFILALVLFFSSGPVISRTGFTPRYMIPILPLFFGILGYMMYNVWKINYQKIASKHYKIISKSWKGFLIIIFAVVLLASLYASKPVDTLIIKQNFEFKNPQVFADQYPLEREELPEKSIIIRGNKRVTSWEYNATPFNPFIGYNEKNQSWKNDQVNVTPIKIMNELLGEGYNLYVFKEKSRGDPSYYRYLEAEHNLILKEYSETFCKLIMIENASTVNNMQIKSDDICHSFLKDK